MDKNKNNNQEYGQKKCNQNDKKEVSKIKYNSWIESLRQWLREAIA